MQFPPPLSHSNQLRHTNNNKRSYSNRHCADNFSNPQPQQQFIPAIPVPQQNPYLFNPRIIPQSNANSVVLPIAAHLIGGVIGRGGRNIQEIRRQTNAEIKIDNEQQNQSQERYITINGTPQQVNSAVYMIKNSLATHT